MACAIRRSQQRRRCWGKKQGWGRGCELGSADNGGGAHTWCIRAGRSGRWVCSLCVGGSGDGQKRRWGTGTGKGRHQRGRVINASSGALPNMSSGSSCTSSAALDAARREAKTEKTAQWSREWASSEGKERTALQRYWRTYGAVRGREETRQSNALASARERKTNESVAMRESRAGAAARGSADQIHCTATAQLPVLPLEIIGQDTP